MSVSGPSKDGLRALWESGVRLDSAWIEFAVFFDRFAHRALHTHPTNDPDVLGLDDPRYKELSKGWLPKTWEARQKKLAITTENGRIHLLGEIYAGDLWAIGFRTLPSGADELVRVPRQHFFFDEAGERGQRPDIHWSKGELTVGGISYFDIRVVRSPEAQTDSSVGASEATDSVNRRRQRDARVGTRKAATGRPNTSRQIAAKARTLWKTDPAFRELPLKRKVGAVRAEILGDEHRNEETRGYRTSSMEKVIGRALSAPRKQNKGNKPRKA